MIDLLLASLITCEESHELIDNIKRSREKIEYKQELIEVLKSNTEPECYEGSEHNS